MGSRSTISSMSTSRRSISRSSAATLAASGAAIELAAHGVPHDVVVDNAGGHLMQHGLVDMVLVGAKAVNFFRRMGGSVVGTATHLGDEPSVNDLIGAITIMLKSYEEGTIDRLFLVGNEFINTMTQNPTVEQLLPLLAEESSDMKHHWDYIYEPDAGELLDDVLTRYIESQVYRGAVENFACEMAAKMVAMKSATDNAEELIKSLSRVMNRARQDSITTEIMEIVGGAEALDSDSKSTSYDVESFDRAFGAII